MRDIILSRMTVGARAAGSMFLRGTEVIPHGSLAWLHAFGDVDPGQALTFAAFGSGMVTYGVPLAQVSALTRASTR